MPRGSGPLNGEASVADSLGRFALQQQRQHCSLSLSSLLPSSSARLSRPCPVSLAPPPSHPSHSPSPPPANTFETVNHVLLRPDALELRLLEMGPLPPAVQQGVPNGGDVRPQARL